MTTETRTHTNVTPEQWRVEETGDYPFTARLMDVQDVTIAMFCQQPDDTWSAIDNAHLAASAPDLLAIVERAEYLATLVRMVSTDEKLLAAANAMYVDARAAIQQAETPDGAR